MMFLLPQWPAAIACNMTDEAVTVAVFSQFTHHTPLTSDALHVSLAVLFVRVFFVFVCAALSSECSIRAAEQ